MEKFSKLGQIEHNVLFVLYGAQNIAIIEVL
jgi:hypothetical protein